MQAIILAAGLGKRLGDLTRDNTKCMVKVNGVPLIDRLLQQLALLPLRRVTIVTGHGRDNLVSHIGTRYNDTLDIEFVHNPLFAHTNNIYSLSLVKDRLLYDDTVLIESDIIFSDAIFERLKECPYDNVAFVAKYRPWMDGTMVLTDTRNNISSFINKADFDFSQSENYLKTVNLYRFSKEFASHKYVPFLDAYIRARGNNEFYEQVLRVLTLIDGSNLIAVDIEDDPWYEIDDIQDLNEAEAIFANDSERVKNLSSRYGGYWRYPHMLDFCYLVNPYFPPQRLKEEIKANMDVLLGDYPSGMRINSMLAGRFTGIRGEYIVPGNGASELIRSLADMLDGTFGVVIPTFEEYINRLPDERVVTMQAPTLSGYRYTADNLIDFVNKNNIKNLLIVNPDNPSGNYIPHDDLILLATYCTNVGTRLIVDESFADFADNEPRTLMTNEMLERFPGLVVVKSISKSYGVPGVRLGFVASANIMLIDNLKKALPIWNINSFAEYFMQIFPKYREDFEVANQSFRAERQRFEKRLSDFKWLHPLSSQANYIMCEVTAHFNAQSLTEDLLAQHNILIKDCSRKIGIKGEYVRIAIRSRRDNDILLSALAAMQDDADGDVMT